MLHTQAIGVKQEVHFRGDGDADASEHPSRVFGASIDGETLSEFDKLGVEPLYEGKISGLNGAFLGLAAESGLAGGFLLGEMPHMFPNVRFPKASLSVLRVFSQLTGITLDFSELESRSEKIETAMAKTLGELEDRMEEKKASDSISESLSRCRRLLMRRVDWVKRNAIGSKRYSKPPRRIARALMN